MITMTDVYKNSNEWLVRKNRIQNEELSFYKQKSKPWYFKIIEYFKEII